MAGRYRKTILDEYQVWCGVAWCGLGQDPCAGDFREEVGAFVIEYLQENNKIPSLGLITEHCISAHELNRLDLMHNHYLKLQNKGINDKEYEGLAKEIS